MVGPPLLSRLRRLLLYRGRGGCFPDVLPRNDFFARVGAMAPLTEDGARRLRDAGPEKALAWFQARCRA